MSVELINLINQVGFPIFACVYLTMTNDKILNTVDKRLEIMDLKLNEIIERGRTNE